jgi:ATP-dependent Clp protease ATP-binding subunit ClpC
VFERFTDRARRVIVLAQEEARLLDHNYIGTEHVLLGLIHEGEGMAAQALEQVGVSLPAVRAEVKAMIGGAASAPSGHIPFTPRAKKVLELSLREALQLGHDYIGTEHLLLGLIREGEGVAAQVLVKLGADLSRVRSQVVQMLGGPPGERPSEAVPAELPSTVIEDGIPTEHRPACPHCRSRLADSASIVPLVVADPATGHSHRVYVLTCGSCGLALGPVPL